MSASYLPIPFVGQLRKIGRKSKAVIVEEVEAKRVKLTKIGSNRGCGYVLTVGQGDTGQLRLGEGHHGEDQARVSEGD